MVAFGIHTTARAGKSAPKRTKSFGLLSEREQFNETRRVQKHWPKADGALFLCGNVKSTEALQMGNCRTSCFQANNGRRVASILLNSLINGVLAAVHGIRANDEIEAMLAVQMVATHFAATRALRRLKGSDTVGLATLPARRAALDVGRYGRVFQPGPRRQTDADGKTRPAAIPSAL